MHLLAKMYVLPTGVNIAVLVLGAIFCLVLLLIRWKSR